MAKNVNQYKPTVVSVVLIGVLFAIIYTSTHLRQILAFVLTNGIVGFSDTTGYHAPDIRYIRNALNIGYLLHGIAMLVFPISLLSFSKHPVAKGRFIKYTCYFIAVTYFMGNMWLVKWMFQGLFRNTGFAADFKAYQDANCYIFNHMSWGCNNGIWNIVDTICGCVWTLIGYNVNRRYKNEYKYLALGIICAFILPGLIQLFRYFISLMFPDIQPNGDELIKELGVSIINGEKIFWWLKKSVFWVLSQTAMVALFFYAARDRDVYETYICLLEGHSGRHTKHREGRNKDDGADGDEEADGADGESGREHSREHSHSHSGTHHHSSGGAYEQPRAGSRAQTGDGKSGSPGHHHHREQINWTPVDFTEGGGERHKLKEIDDNVKIGNILNMQSGGAGVEDILGPATHAVNRNAGGGGVEFSPMEVITPAAHVRNDTKGTSGAEFKGSAEVAPAKQEEHPDDEGDIVWISKK